MKRINLDTESCEREAFYTQQLRDGIIRRVSPKRARKLRNRGSKVWFCHWIDCYVWEPKI